MGGRPLSFNPLWFACFLACLPLIAHSSALWGEGAAPQQSRAGKEISIVWSGGRPGGQIQVTDGSLGALNVSLGKGSIQSPDRFTSLQDGPFRLTLQVQGTAIRYGKGGTVVTVATKENPFSFFLRDASREYPIFIPAYGVVVTPAEDTRSYAEIVNAIRARGLQTKLAQFETEPEETFDAAALNARELKAPTWLGLSRDIRTFEIGVRLETVKPRFHYPPVPLPENRNNPVEYQFLMGRGIGFEDKIERRLEEGVLPILKGTLIDGDITYELTAFVTLESTPLSAKAMRGTHYLVADGYGAGHMFTKEQQAQYDALLPSETKWEEEAVLYLRLTAVNTAAVQRYAFLRNVVPNIKASSGGEAPWSLDHAKGFGTYPSGRVFAVSKLNGKPLAAEELAILLKPGEAATLEINLPHEPISAERAANLAKKDFDERLATCRQYWKEKLAAATQINLPEKRMREMIRAGLLHLDLITYGREPEGTLVPMIGVYTAIGSESAPIIQFMDSMGWHTVARRAAMFFLDKQHEDGFIQNFGNYMLETGPALWTLGEHYRYTRDDQWVKQIEPKLLKACEFMLKWRQRNMRDDLRGKGYGLMEGKTADPEDLFRSFMLNGYGYLGMSRVAEMLQNVDPAASRKWRGEAEAFKVDIRRAFAETMDKSPVIPLADGTWVPTVPPWVEYRGPLSLFADGGNWFTHGAVVGRDSMLGPLWLVFQEVIEPSEPAATFMLNFHNDLMTKQNAAFTQPYYSRHEVIHLRRGEVKPFLKTYYNTVAGLADRQTYTFYEHFYATSFHKTHEEAWFLMQTRWMLYLEDGNTLRLLPGVPRAYLADGKHIEIQRAATYFGPVSLRVDSQLNQGRIVATVECATDRKPQRIELRLPHPQGRKATAVTGGKYHPETETVTIEPFTGRAEITLGFGAMN